MQRGARNLRLFDAVRFWCYSINKGLDVHAWMRRVRVHALECNRRLPEPWMRPSKADGLQHQHLVLVRWRSSVALRPFQRSPEKARLKLGRMRRAKVADRDKAIIDAYREGASMRAIAREWGLHHRAVQHVLKRGVSTEPNQCMPWGG